MKRIKSFAALSALYDADKKAKAKAKYLRRARRK